MELRDFSSSESLELNISALSFTIFAHALNGFRILAAGKHPNGNVPMNAIFRAPKSYRFFSNEKSFKNRGQHANCLI